MSYFKKTQEVTNSLAKQLHAIPIQLSRSHKAFCSNFPSFKLALNSKFKAQEKRAKKLLHFYPEPFNHSTGHKSHQNGVL